MKRSADIPSYKLSRVFTTKICEQEINYVSKPGLANWDTVTPTQVLIAQEVKLTTGERALWLGCGHGASAAYLAKTNPEAEFWLHDHNYVALEMAQQTFQINPAEKCHLFPSIELNEQQIGFFNQVVIDLPKGRNLYRRWILQAWEALQPGGHLYLAGPKDQGVQSAIKDAQTVFGQPAILGYKKGCRIARFTKNFDLPDKPAWFEQPGVRPRSWAEVEFMVDGTLYNLFTLPGIFSSDRLDDGTQLLLKSVEIPKEAAVLDLGCGYGIIGIFSALHGASGVDLVDSNLLAVAAARKNADKYRLARFDVQGSDVLSTLEDRTYDLILTNPPFHAGKAVDYQLANAFIEQSYAHLTPQGQFVLVANQFIRYEKVMGNFFAQVDQKASSSGFTVWRGNKANR